MSTEPAKPSQPPTEELIDYPLADWQYESIFGDAAKVRMLYIVGGRGCGKSHTDAPRVIHWSELATDLPFGIFASTEAQLQTVLSPIAQLVDELGVQTVYEG